jgi:hypothetical protein
MTIGLPFHFQPNGEYQPDSGARLGLPRHAQWLLDSRGGGGDPPRDPVLRLIDESISTYETRPDLWEKVSVLGQLYFLVDYWLKKAQTESNPLVRARQSAVFDLYRSVVEELCFSLDCKVNYLPERLQQIWGRILSQHGYAADNGFWAPKGLGWERKPIRPGTAPKVVEYLDKAEQEKYRLVFDKGRAFQSTWWDPRHIKLIPAESASVGWEYGPGAGNVPMFEPGFAGFALSMGREFYMAKHYGMVDPRRLNFFHSSYLSGGAVLCAGSMLIKNGQVLAIKNDSGHYKPAIGHLVNAVQALQMYGIPVNKIRIIAVARSWNYADGRPGTTDLDTTGARLLTRRAGAAGTTARMEANDVNLQGRGYTAYKAMLRRLP